MQLVIVSGLSGAGKTVALKQYEDMGYYCIDNLPLALVGGPISPRTLASIQQRYEQLAIGIDARESASEIAAFPRYMDQLRKTGLDIRVLFLTASDETILRRYSETRRKHPLSGTELSLTEAIARERELLRPIADYADYTIDTSDYNLHELRDAVRAHYPARAGAMALTFESFGFKNGVPDGMDYVFDVRCLPNPHWNPELRPLTGYDEAVAAFLGAEPDVSAMIDDIRGFLERWLPRFREQDRAYVTIGVGCTGGRHRSVYLVERLGVIFREQYDPVIVRHRELPG